MTDDEKRHKIIMEYLKYIGYPNIPPQRVIDELPNIWRLLESSNLIPSDMNYNMFKRIAISSHNNELTKAQFDTMFRKSGK